MTEGGALAPLRFPCTRSSLASKLGATSFIRLQVETLRQTGDTRLVENEEHVNPGDRLSGQFRRPHPQFPFFSRALLVKRKLHVAITSGQAVGVMVAPKHHHRRNLIRV